MSKICKKCGALNKDSALKCDKCGTRLESDLNEKMLSLFYPFCQGDESTLSLNLFSLIVAVLLPILFFFILFLTLYIDKISLGFDIPSFPFFILMSVLFGIGSVLVQSLIVFLLAKINGKNIRPVHTAVFFSFGYTIPFITAVIGLIFRLAFGWSMILFGILGLLLSLIPLWNYLCFKNKNKLINAGIVIVYGFILCLLTNLLLSI